jgi:tRNA(Ile)-lysidine synthase
VSKYFKDQKIALHEKDHVWVLESNKRIVWLCSMRLDERFKLLPKTQHVLRVEVR